MMILTVTYLQCPSGKSKSPVRRFTEIIERLHAGSVVIQCADVVLLGLLEVSALEAAVSQVDQGRGVVAVGVPSPLRVLLSLLKFLPL